MKKETPDIYKGLKETLDRTFPRWEYEWADQRDLINYARICDEDMERNAKRILRSRQEQKFHYIINAAIEIGLVRLPEPKV